MLPARMAAWNVFLLVVALSVLGINPHFAQSEVVVRVSPVALEKHPSDLATAEIVSVAQADVSPTATRTVTRTPHLEPRPTNTNTPSLTPSRTLTPTPPSAPSPTKTETVTNTPTPTAWRPATRTPRFTATRKVSATPTATLILCSPQFKPKLLHPRDGAKRNPPRAKLNWTDVPCVESYHVSVRLDAINGRRVVGKRIRVSHHIMTDLERGHTYYWRVRVKNSPRQKGRWSEWFHFTVKDRRESRFDIDDLLGSR